MTSRMTGLLITFTGISLSLTAALAGNSKALAANATKPSSLAASTPLSVLQSKIELGNAGWTAGESSVTRMNPKDWPSLLGLISDEAPDIQFDNHLSETADGGGEFAVRTESTTSLDWRSRSGANWVSPILNQGQCGSCVAFASIGTLETQLRIESGYSGYNAKLSPQYLFSCGGASCSYGWTPSSAAQFLEKYGATDEACMPYASQTGSDTSCKKACGDAASRRMRISSFTQPTSGEHNIAAVKAALKNGPLVTTMNVYDDFMYYQSGVYKHVSGKRAGSHAISIVGYDDNLRALIMRNSWGPDWGEMGFAKISYDDISGLGDSTWSFRVAPLKGISMQTPADGSYAYRTVQVQTHSTVTNVKSVRALVYNANRQQALMQNLSTSNLNISSLPSGRYEIEVQAVDKNSNVVATSQRHYFFVSGSAAGVSSNHLSLADAKEDVSASNQLFSLENPRLQLAFNADDTTAKAKLSKAGMDSQYFSRAKSFKISANVGNQEVTRMSFHFRRANHSGSTALIMNEVVRSTEHVRDGALLTWKTDGLRSGDYEYWITGDIDGNGQDVKAESEHHFIAL